MFRIQQKTLNSLPLWQLLCLAGLVSGCGVSTSLDLTESIAVVMYGKLIAPDSATGNSSPSYQMITLSGFTMTLEDGTDVDLFEGKTPTEYRIVGRPQIVFELDLKDHTDAAVTAFTAYFDSTITVGSTSEEHTVALDSTSVTHSEAFNVIRAKNYRLEVYSYWKNTITIDEETGNETASSPSFASALNPN